jgi:hypothetical protein
MESRKIRSASQDRYARETTKIIDHNRSAAEIDKVKFRRLSQIFSKGIQLEFPECNQLGGIVRLFGFLSGTKKRIGGNLCNLWLSIFASNGDAPLCRSPGLHPPKKTGHPRT